MPTNRDVRRAKKRVDKMLAEDGVVRIPQQKKRKRWRSAIGIYLLLIGAGSGYLTLTKFDPELSRIEAIWSEAASAIAGVLENTDSQVESPSVFENPETPSEPPLPSFEVSWR